MNKKGRKRLHLNAETIRRLSPAALGEAVGGNTAYCTVITRCIFSCPCGQETYTCADTCAASCWECP